MQCLTYTQTGVCRCIRKYVGWCYLAWFSQIQVVIHPVALQQVVHTVSLPPAKIELLVQVMAIAAEVDKARISAITVFIMFPCLNDKTA